jgi:hypothetical protein
MWNSIDTLPDFNGRVEVKIIKEEKEIIISCWYEMGNRRFPQGFSLLNPRLIPLIVEWRKELKSP